MASVVVRRRAGAVLQEPDALAKDTWLGLARDHDPHRLRLDRDGLRLQAAPGLGRRAAWTMMGGLFTRQRWRVNRSEASPSARNAKPIDEALHSVAISVLSNVKSIAN